MYLEVVFSVKLKRVFLKDKFECSFKILCRDGRAVFIERVVCFAHCLCTLLLRYIRNTPVFPKAAKTRKGQSEGYVTVLYNMHSSRLRVCLPSFS